MSNEHRLTRVYLASCNGLEIPFSFLFPPDAPESSEEVGANTLRQAAVPTIP